MGTDRTGYDELLKRFPTVEHLRDTARRCAPRFCFEYADGGAGADQGVLRNREALDAIALVPRYGALTSMPSTETELFGRRYSAPIGVSPMGMPAIVLPGADLILAKAAQAARIPYTLGVVGGATIEEIAAVAPDVSWLQLYRCGGQDHAMTFDLMRRAQAAGVHVLVMTLDVPVRTPRPREIVAGFSGGKFRPNARMVWDILTHPYWGLALLRNGLPRFANLKPYCREGAGLNDVIRFAQQNVGGIYSWDDIARYRDRWPGPFVVKGILHPADAEKALSIGVNGIFVSNHGGRQVDALPAAIDCLPAIVKTVGNRATVLMDSGIRSGSDVVRALALGAAAAFAGKAFLWSMCALRADGPRHVINLLTREVQTTFAQLGANGPREARTIRVEHPRAMAADK